MLMACFTFKFISTLVVNRITQCRKPFSITIATGVISIEQNQF